MGEGPPTVPIKSSDAGFADQYGASSDMQTLFTETLIAGASPPMVTVPLEDAGSFAPQASTLTVTVVFASGARVCVGAVACNQGEFVFKVKLPVPVPTLESVTDLGVGEGPPTVPVTLKEAGSASQMGLGTADTDTTIGNSREVVSIPMRVDSTCSVGLYVPACNVRLVKIEISPPLGGNSSGTTFISPGETLSGLFRDMSIVSPRQKRDVGVSETFAVSPAVKEKLFLLIVKTGSARIRGMVKMFLEKCGSIEKEPKPIFIPPTKSDVSDKDHQGSEEHARSTCPSGPKSIPAYGPMIS